MTAGRPLGSSIYRVMRPCEPPTIDCGAEHVPIPLLLRERYDLSAVDRGTMNMPSNSMSPDPIARCSQGGTSRCDQDAGRSARRHRARSTISITSAYRACARSASYDETIPHRPAAHGSRDVFFQVAELPSVRYRHRDSAGPSPPNPPPPVCDFFSSRSCPQSSDHPNPSRDPPQRRLVGACGPRWLTRGPPRPSNPRRARRPTTAESAPIETPECPTSPAQFARAKPLRG